jgi:hypothetical protein
MKKTRFLQRGFEGTEGNEEVIAISCTLYQDGRGQGEVSMLECGQEAPLVMHSRLPYPDCHFASMLAPSSLLHAEISHLLFSPHLLLLLAWSWITSSTPGKKTSAHIHKKYMRASEQHEISSFTTLRNEFKTKRGLSSSSKSFLEREKIEEFEKTQVRCSVCAREGQRERDSEEKIPTPWR